MFKLLALFGIFFGLGTLGILKAYQLKQRVMLLEEYLKFILDIKGSINYLKEPLPCILKKREKNAGLNVKKLLNGILSDIDEKNGEIVKMWANNVKLAYDSTPLTLEDKEILTYAGTFIGQTDYENQQYRFEHLENMLSRQIVNAKEICVTKGSLFSKLGFLIGAMIGILFI